MKKTALMACAALTVTMAGAHAAAQRDEKVYAAVRGEQGGRLDLLKQIVNIDSGTGDVAGGNKVAAHPGGAAEGAGRGGAASRKAKRPICRTMCVAVFHGTGKGKILIIAHFDTVFGPGTVTGRPFSIDSDNRAHGPGVGDEKAGDVVAMTALKTLHDLNFKNYASITVLLDASEERGSPSCAQLIKTLSAESDVEFNMEPGDAPDVLTVWRKGAADVVIHVEGRAAHAGMVPQNGRNAAMELIHQINALGNSFPTSGDGMTANLTLMKAGSRANIIPDSAEATFDVRFRKPEELEPGRRQVKANAAKTHDRGHQGDSDFQRQFPAADGECADPCAGRARRCDLCRAGQEDRPWRQWRGFGIGGGAIGGHARAGRAGRGGRRFPHRP